MEYERIYSSRLHFNVKKSFIVVRWNASFCLIFMKIHTFSCEISFLQECLLEIVQFVYTMQVHVHDQCFHSYNHNQNNPVSQSWKTGIRHGIFLY